VAHASAHRTYPYLIFDARYEKVRRGGQVISQGVLVAIGISAAGYREVTGCWVAESESEASWGAVFSELKQRGLRGVRYVVSDYHAGMVKAIERHFQGAVCGSAARCILCATRWRCAGGNSVLWCCS